MNEDLTKLIVDGLSHQQSRNEIIREVCERSGMNWPEAERLLERVEVEQAHTIARRQSPLLIFLSAGTFLVGMLLLAASIEAITGILKPDMGTWLAQAVYLFGGGSPIAVGVTGLAMIAGGIIGMWKTLLRYFET